MRRKVVDLEAKVYLFLFVLKLIRTLISSLYISGETLEYIYLPFHCNNSVHIIFNYQKLNFFSRIHLTYFVDSSKNETSSSQIGNIMYFFNKNKLISERWPNYKNSFASTTFIKKVLWIFCRWRIFFWWSQLSCFPQLSLQQIFQESKKLVKK